MAFAHDTFTTIYTLLNPDQSSWSLGTSQEDPALTPKSDNRKLHGLLFNVVIFECITTQGYAAILRTTLQFIIETASKKKCQEKDSLRWSHAIPVDS